MVSCDWTAATLRVLIGEGCREGPKVAMPAWITAVGVLGTWCIFGAAIWGERIRSSLFKPELRVALDSSRGVSTTEIITTIGEATTAVSGVTIGHGQSLVQQYTRPARYYYVSVSNDRRWPVAHDVRILITQLEAPDPGGVPTTVWTGEIPLRWEHAEIHPASRTVGRRARADLAVVAEDPEEAAVRQKQLHLLTVIAPTNFQRSYYTATKRWVTLIATSTETESRPLRLELAWDGQWVAGNSEMAQHLIIRQT